MNYDGVLSSLDGPLPEPAPRYAITARALRKLGRKARNDDYKMIDDWCEAIEAGKDAEPAKARITEQDAAFLRACGISG